MGPDSLGEIRNRGGRSERYIEIKARRRRAKKMKCRAPQARSEVDNISHNLKVIKNIKHFVGLNKSVFIYQIFFKKKKIP